MCLTGTLSLNPNVYDKNVEALQKRLTDLGYTGKEQKPLIADGKFGPSTLLAVNAFKTNNKLGNTGEFEGKIGEQSWGVLFSTKAVSAAGVTHSKTLVYYSQEDPRWKNILYSNHRDAKQTIAASGCGPTCMAMVASSIKDKVILPPETARFATDHKFRTYDNGTAWGFFGAFAVQHSLSCKQTADFEEVKRALSAGSLVIASMRSGHFTSGGHYIVLASIKTIAGAVCIEVLDPNIDNTRYGKDGLVDEGAKNDGKVTARESLFRKEGGQYWIFATK